MSEHTTSEEIREIQRYVETIRKGGEVDFTPADMDLAHSVVAALVQNLVSYELHFVMGGLTIQGYRKSRWRHDPNVVNPGRYLVRRHMESAFTIEVFIADKQSWWRYTGEPKARPTGSREEFISKWADINPLQE